MKTLIKVLLIVSLILTLSCEKQPVCYECLTTITSEYTQIKISGSKELYSIKRETIQLDILCDVPNPEEIISKKLMITIGIGPNIDSCYRVENSWTTTCKMK